MTNNNNHPVDIPKTYTVSYFDEAEWNKDLTSSEITQQQEFADLQQNQLLSQERGYGPCIKHGTINYDNCHCPIEELNRQRIIIENIKAAAEAGLGTFSTNRRFKVTFMFNSGSTNFYFRTNSSSILNLGGDEVNWSIGGSDFSANLVNLYWTATSGGRKYFNMSIAIQNIQQLERLLNVMGNEIVVSTEIGVIPDEFMVNKVKEKIRELIEEHKKGENIDGFYSF